MVRAGTNTEKSRGSLEKKYRSDAMFLRKNSEKNQIPEMIRKSPVTIYAIDFSFFLFSDAFNR